MNEHDRYETATTLRRLELAEQLRSVELQLLHALGLLRGVDPDLNASAAIVLSRDDTAELLSTCERIAQEVDLVNSLAAALPAEEIELRRSVLLLEAGAALGAGVADIDRVEVLARCLPARTGFQALAAMLRSTTYHENWQHTTVGQVLGCFRDANEHLVQRVAALATLAPETE